MELSKSICNRENIKVQKKKNDEFRLVLFDTPLWRIISVTYRKKTKLNALNKRSLLFHQAAFLRAGYQIHTYSAGTESV